MSTKRCNSCGEIFPATEEFFYKLKNGKLYYRCKKCDKTSAKSYIKQRAELVKQRRIKLTEWYVSYKQRQRCSHCGESDWVVIEFHHPDKAQKEVNPSHMIKNGWSISRMEKALKLCVPLCANCHRIEHYEEV